MDNRDDFHLDPRYTELGHYLTAWVRTTATNPPTDTIHTLHTVVVLMPLDNLNRCLISRGFTFQDIYDWNEIECLLNKSSIDHILLFTTPEKIHFRCNYNML